MSTGDEYGESGMEYMSDLRDNDVDMENRQQEMHIGRNCPDMWFVASLVIYVSKEESECVLRDNRRECS